MFAFIFVLFLPSISGRRILITGSTDGIGRQTAWQLAEKGHALVLHGRNQSRCDDVIAWLQSRLPSAHFPCLIGDFLDLHQVVALADEVKREVPDLDTIILNAGVFFRTAQVPEMTSYGLEHTYHVNHLAHFLLIHHLLELLKANAPSRIVFTASQAHRWAKESNWDDIYANKTSYQSGGSLGRDTYSRSKLFNVMTADILADHLQENNVTANSLHPGHWQTKVSGWSGRPVEGVRVVAYAAAHPDLEGVSGQFFEQHVRDRWEDVVGRKSRLARDEQKKQKMCRQSLDLLRSWNIHVPNPIC